MAICTRTTSPVSTAKGGRVDAIIARISRIKGAGARDANELRWRNQDISRLKAKIKDLEEGWLTPGKDVCDEPTQPGSFQEWRDEMIQYARIAIWSHNIKIDKRITYWSSWLADHDAP